MLAKLSRFRLTAAATDSIPASAPGTKAPGAVKINYPETLHLWIYIKSHKGRPGEG